MLDHVSLGTHELNRSAKFYTEMLAPLGYRLQVLNETEAGFGIGEEWVFFLYPVSLDAALVGARMHVAFRAATRHQVINAHATAVRAGAAAVPGREPAERPQFGAGYFGCAIKDLDGHTIELMTRERTDQTRI